MTDELNKREYPRIVYKTRDDRRKVNTIEEENQAAEDGYEGHWEPDIVEKIKGTSLEILRKSNIELRSLDTVESENDDDTVVDETKIGVKNTKSKNKKSKNK